MNPLISIIFCVGMIFSSVGSAQVYTWVNPDGSREYGDEPPANAKKAKLPRLQTLPSKPLATKKNESLRVETLKDKNRFKGYESLSIVTPKEDKMILAAKAGSANIQLHIQPALQTNHEVSLFLDGKEIQRGPQLYFELQNIYRGSHLLQAKIKYKGKLLISSPKRRIHVQRPSILNR